MKKNSQGTKYLIRIVAVTLVAVLLIGCGLVSNTPPGTDTPPQPAVVQNTQPPAQSVSNPVAPLLSPTGNLETDVSAVAKQASPAVVFVGIEANLSQFSQPQPIGNGSGVIIDSDGHILTNNHVVESASALDVTLPDGRTFNATLVGRDPNTDLAIIQIHGNNLPILQLGDSNQLQVGQFVVAIGNALGLEGGPTVTAGVVSAMNRTIQEENDAFISDLIQTDAAINPGNSGGPLVNLNGQVIGINTAEPGTTSQGVQPSGIGFAISINSAKPIIQQLITQGKVIRPYLGVQPVTLTPAIRSQFQVTVQQGVILATVSDGSPAAQAGLKEGDVITAADGKPVADEQALRAAITAHKIGDTISLTVVRGSQQMNVQAKLVEAPAP